jgi:hypothetical protein
MQEMRFALSTRAKVVLSGGERWRGPRGEDAQPFREATGFSLMQRYAMAIRERDVRKVAPRHRLCVCTT